MALWCPGATLIRCWSQPTCCSGMTTLRTVSCSSIMYAPIQHGSLQPSWRRTNLMFCHGWHIPPTCHPLSISGISQDDTYPDTLPVHQTTRSWWQLCSRSSRISPRTISDGWFDPWAIIVQLVSSLMLAIPNINFLWHSHLHSSQGKHFVDHVYAINTVPISRFMFSNIFSIS